MRDDLAYQDIVERLNEMAERVAVDCIPDGRVDGNYWRGDCHGKISVHIRGARVGMVGAWQGQFGAKTGGNLIALIELAHGFSSHGEAVRYAKSHYLGIGDRELTPEQKKRWQQQQDESKRKADQRRSDEERQKARKVETVRSIWDEAKPISGTLAEVYLRSREIDLAPWPPSLRFHPCLKLGDERHPALIGGVQAKDRKLIAIWRVFLRTDGSALTGEDGKKVKLGYGPATGGAVRFGPVTETLRVAEGMETALGVMLLNKPGASTWATLSTSGMIGFDIPDGVKRIEIYADGDRFRLNKKTEKVELPPGISAAEKLKQRAEELGVKAVVFPSPEPDDWLDVWISKAKDMRQRRAVEYPE